MHEEYETYKSHKQKTTQSRRNKRHKTIDPESTCYKREIMEDWKSENFKNSLNFTTMHKKSVNKKQGEFWLKTDRNNENQLAGGHWEPEILHISSNSKSKLGTNIINKTTDVGEFWCFNNNINIDYTN